MKTIDSNGNILKDQNFESLRTVVTPEVGKQKKEAESTVDVVKNFPQKLETNNLLKNMSQQQSALLRLERLFEVGDTNEIAATAVSFTFPRAFGEVGNLTEDEKDAWKTGKSLIRELEQKWENLRGLRKAYMELEKEILEKEKVWAILKK